MKTKIAVFYHARISGGLESTTSTRYFPLNIPFDFGHQVLKEQMDALQESGLYAGSNELVIGINGTAHDEDAISAAAPDGCDLLLHGPKARGLLPTMRYLQSWLPGHEDWLVCFFHTKGVGHPGDPFYADWRKCMEKHVVWNWRRCVRDLQAGFDTVGAHWLDNQPQDFARWGQGGHFWGGVFWWAKASYLKTLRPLLPQIRVKDDWYEPEHWVGTNPPAQPKALDYAPHWPNQTGCHGSSTTPIIT